MASWYATVAQLTSDSAAIGKLANANETPYQLAITDSLPNIVSDLSALNGDFDVVSLTATSGSATLSDGGRRKRGELLGDGLGDEPHHRRGLRLRRRVHSGGGIIYRNNDRGFLDPDRNRDPQRDD